MLVTNVNRQWCLFTGRYPFPTKIVQSARMLKMSSANTVCIFSALFDNILYDVCVTDYAELYALSQQLSVA